MWKRVSCLQASCSQLCRYFMLDSFTLTSSLSVYCVYKVSAPICMNRAAYLHRKQIQRPSQQSVCPHQNLHDCDDDQVATRGHVYFKSNEQGNTVRGGKSCGSRQVSRISNRLGKVVSLLPTSSVNVRSALATHVRVRARKLRGWFISQVLKRPDLGSLVNTFAQATAL